MKEKYSIVDKRKWLEEYEKGTLPGELREKYKCDIRTIKKGIEDARRERDAALARSELFKDSLRRHHDQLLDVIKDLLSAVNKPATNVDMRVDNNGNLEFVILPGAKIARNEKNVLELLFQDEGTVEWDLLKEHLSRERIFGRLSIWKRLVIEHFKDRAALKTKGKSLMEKETGLNVKKCESGREESRIDPVTIDLFFQETLNKSLGIPDLTNLKGNLVVESLHVSHRKGGTILAYDLHNTEECKNSLIRAIQRLQDAVEVKDCSNSYNEIVKQTPRIRTKLEDVRLTNMINGQCRICRRLGG